MGGFNFSTFQDDKKGQNLLPVPVHQELESNPVLLPAPPARGTEAEVVGTLVSGAAVTINPNLMVWNIVDKALSVIPDICKCFAEVSIAKQETQRIRVQVDGAVKIKKQETKAFVTQQMEETKRLEIQCQKELRLRELELKEVSIRLKAHAKEARRQHAVDMKNLCIVEDAVQSLISQKKIFIEKMITANSETSEQDKDRWYAMIESINMKLSAIAQDIIQVRSTMMQSVKGE